jgi:hypothetical protein
MAGRLDVVLTYWPPRPSKRVVAARQTSTISLRVKTAGRAPVGRSGGEALVPVVQAADLGSLHDLAHGWRMSLSRVGRVLAQREMRP